MKYNDIKSKINTTLTNVDPIVSNSHSNSISSIFIKKNAK